MCTPVIESETENNIPPSSFDREVHVFFGPKISRDPEPKFWPCHIYMNKHFPVFNEYRFYKKTANLQSADCLVSKQRV